MKTALPDRALAIVAAAALLVPAGLTAQGHHDPGADGREKPEETARPGATPGACPMAGGGMMQGMRSPMADRDLMGPGPWMLLHQQEALGLSEAQVEELERIRDRLDERRSAHRSEMSEVRDQLRELARSDRPDLDRLESLLRERGDRHVEMQLEMAEIHREALGVLSDEQRSNARYGLRMMRSMRSGHGTSPGMAGHGGGMPGRMDGTGHPAMTERMEQMHQKMHGRECLMSRDSTRRD